MQTLLRLDLAPSQKLQLVEQILWITDFTTLQVEQLAHYFKAYTAERGSFILQEGDLNQRLMIIVEGQVSVFKESTSEQDKELQILGKGKMIGEISFFDGGPCSASIIAKDSVTLLSLDQHDFNRLANDHPFIALKITKSFIGLLSRRLRQTTGRLIDVL